MIPNPEDFKTVLEATRWARRHTRYLDGKSHQFEINKTAHGFVFSFTNPHWDDTICSDEKQSLISAIIDAVGRYANVLD